MAVLTIFYSECFCRDSRDLQVGILEVYPLDDLFSSSAQEILSPEDGRLQNKQ